MALLLVTVVAVLPPAVGRAQSAPQWSGFGIVGGASQSDDAIAREPLSAQLQLGFDWYPSPTFGSHVHLVARTDDGSSLKGAVGVAEAYLEGNFFSRASRVRLRAGAMFLPTSLENVDALWENPFTISSSALNTWLGEELRPIGLDASYFHRGAMVGATVYRGNDTFGALPPVRGWTLGDRWTLLGEKVPINEDSYTSVSAETDRRLGWSARAGWSGRRIYAQYTHIDNRSDALRYGDLENWNTRFHIVGAGYSLGNWTLAGETGWGPTFVIARGRQFVRDIHAAYVLVSKRFTKGRASVRIDSFGDGRTGDEALTLAYIWMPRGNLRAAAEVVATGSERRAQLELRYSFSVR
ncbi:MAG TPA: hypothetical protein VLK65_28185 [Vicinamibacteria bacterium]|nr:hypothetical protein [Vicinamibacteria bacterium]